MSTELFPALAADEILRLQSANQQKEQRWLINSLIRPELDSILETLVKCLELLMSPNATVLAVTSSRTEQAKGVMSRVSNEITTLDLHLHLNTFSKPLHLLLNAQCHLEMQQLTELIRLVNDTITATLILKDRDTHNTDAFAQQLECVLSNLTKCNATLTKPSETLLFPQHATDITQIFKPDGNKLDHYRDRLSMDFFVQNGELSLEIRSLYLVTEEPWCQVDTKTGKSHVDKLRDDLKQHKLKITDILEPEGSVKGRLTHALRISRFTHNDYLTRGVTYNGRVVIEVEKTVIHCQDPLLLSIGAKLNGLEHLVSKMYSNLDLSMM